MSWEAQRFGRGWESQRSAGGVCDTSTVVSDRLTRAFTWSATAEKPDWKVGPGITALKTHSKFSGTECEMRTNKMTWWQNDTQTWKMLLENMLLFHLYSLSQQNRRYCCWVHEIVSSAIWWNEPQYSSGANKLRLWTGVLMHRPFLSTDKNRETNWKIDPKNPKQGNIRYTNTGFIEVARKGYYFIYSQMYYYDGSTTMMGHLTFINNKKVMESYGNVISPAKKFNTKFHGGVFLLESGDQISVRHPYTTLFFMSNAGSYFGAFMIYPVQWNV